MTKSAASLALLLLLSACGKEAPPKEAAGSASKSRYALPAEPSGAVSVTVAMAAAPKDDVAVVGRVRDFTKGFVAFTFVDAALDYCGQKHEAGKEEGCPEPWDYCCYPTEDIAKNTVSVVVKDAKGNPVAAPKPPELRNLDLIVVKGRLVKDKAGNVEIEATGWYWKERPTLPPDTVFPQ